MIICTKKMDYRLGTQCQRVQNQVESTDATTREICQKETMITSANLKVAF